MPLLNGIRACVFDAYGTLFDFASAAKSCPLVPEGKREALTELWREKQIQYTFLRTLGNAYADFWQVTGDALDYALDALGLAEAQRRDALMQLYLKLDAFPEVPAVLGRLKSAGLTTAILSNGSPVMLRAATEAAGIAGQLDHVLSVDAVDVFKTHPKTYQYALDQLGLRAQEICFISSNGWDAWGASAFGMKVVWCNRKSLPAERLPGRPDHIGKSLAELPELVGA